MNRLLAADALWLQKDGNDVSEWEDSFHLSESTGRFCVSDGASSSARADVWSSILTRGFVSDPFHPGDETALSPWLARRCDEFAESTPATTAASSWYAHEVAARHAFATFLGAIVGQDADGRLVISAVSIGDCNAFIVRDRVLVEAWPLTDAADFGGHPELVVSDPDTVAATAATARRWRAHLLPGDTVLLASDAIAEWALSVSATEPVVWSLLSSFAQADLVDLVDDLRKAEEIVNDDVTLLRCTVAA